MTVKVIVASRPVLTRVYHWLSCVLTVCPSIQRPRRAQKNRPLIAPPGRQAPRTPRRLPVRLAGGTQRVTRRQGQHAEGNVSGIIFERLTASAINDFSSLPAFINPLRLQRTCN